MRLLERIEQTIESTLGISPEGMWQITATAALIAGFVVLSRISRRIIQRSFSEPSSRFLISKAVGYVLWILLFVLFARIWVHAATGLATYLGLLSAGLAIALQDPLANLAGWLFILVRSPFRIGQRIQIGVHTGDVVDIRPFRIVMLEIGNWVHADQSTGRVLHIPNGWVFKHPIANYDEAFGYIWNELEVTVTFESNWRHAKEAFSKIITLYAEAHSEEAKKQIHAASDSYHLRFTKLTPVVWTSVVDSGIRLTMRYLCAPRERRTSSSELWEAVLDAVEAMRDVELAYPTTRFYDQTSEGRVKAPDLAEASPQNGGAKIGP
jgi:small-conductance mechanosensitive channel